MTRLERAKAYANAAYERNVEQRCCDCEARREKDAAEKLAQVMRIIAARFPVEAKVIQIEHRRSK